MTIGTITNICYHSCAVICEGWHDPPLLSQQGKTQIEIKYKFKSRLIVVYMYLGVRLAYIYSWLTLTQQSRGI